MLTIMYVYVLCAYIYICVCVCVCVNTPTGEYHTPLSTPFATPGNVCVCELVCLCFAYDLDPSAPQSMQEEKEQEQLDSTSSRRGLEQSTENRETAAAQCPVLSASIHNVSFQTRAPRPT